MLRTIENGNLRLEHVDKEVELVGWVAKKRNFGQLVFIDLRDRSGICQLVFDEAFSEQTKEIRNEYVLHVKGVVKARKDANPNLATGQVEVQVEAFDIVNEALTPPMIIADETDALEDTRLKYRYLDLRRPCLQKNLILRNKVTLLVRNYLAKHGFVEVETPILCRSTPEGARDYLVPSRISKGEFYALPQSPQLYKQLLMVGGMDRYFQIARCFRDEDLRADRQPEFSQIDIEMSFIEEEDIWQMTEGLMKEIFKEIKGIDFAYITLHAGLGNFRDIDVEDLTKHKMDSEQMIVNAEAVNTVNRAKDKGKNVCAVGTTVMRAIESAVSTDGHLKEFEGWTNKFIFPPYEFTVANSMISNFHMPLSTLLMIVAAFGGYEQVMDAYHVALKEGYRFGTYGDAMLILDK